MPMSIAAMRMYIERSLIMRTPGAEYLIRQRISALGRALPAAKAGNTTSLHQARVATRRLRAALPTRRVRPQGGEDQPFGAPPDTRAQAPFAEL